MPGKQVTELDALPSFTDTSLLPVHNGAGLKKGSLSQLANYLGTKFSNPNLLINPDFKINQRGNETYTKDNQGPAIYTIDRWAVWNATLNANSMLLKAYDSGIGLIMQRLENKINGISTVSFEVSSISGTLTALARGTSGNSLGEISVTQKGIYQFTANGEISDITFKISAGGSVTFAWAKLEHGSIATPFVAPNPAEELVKCLRFSRYIPILYCTPYRRYLSEITTSQQYFLPSDCVFENKLRTKGTITVGGVYDTTGASMTGVKSIEYSTDEIRAITLSGSVNTYIIMLKKVFIDAEIY
jgi:hypothetical protein